MNEQPAHEPHRGQRGGEAGGDWWGARRFGFLLAGLIAVSFWKAVLGLGTFAIRDYGLFSYPVAYFHRQAFWKGELPFWNPLDCCGVPFLAQLNTLALYPLSLIYLLLPMPWSLSLFCVFHLFLGGMGMYCLAARWTGSRAGGALAGIVFSFNGLSLNFMMWPSHIATFAWMPWVLFLAEAGWRQGGRKLIWASLAGAMEVLGGGPETILFTALLLLAMALIEGAKRTTPPLVLFRRLLLMGLLVFGLAAPQLLPFADLAMHSSRSTHFGRSDWSMPLWGWGNFLVPLFQTTRSQGIAVQPDQFWTASYYAGMGAAFLVVVGMSWAKGWRVCLTGGLLMASMVLAMGDNALFYLWLRRAAPFLGLFRYPIKFVILSLAVIPLLAAFGLSQYENGKKRFGRAEWVLAGAAVLIVGALLWFARYRPVAESLWPATLGNGVSRLAFLALVLVAIYFFVRRPAQRRWSVLMLLLVCWLDLITAMPWQNPTLDPSVYQTGLGRMSAHLNPAPNVAESRLMLSPSAAGEIYYHPQPDLRKNYLLDRVDFLDDCNILDDLPKVDGFFSLALREMDRVLRLLNPATGPQLVRLEDFLGVSQTMAAGQVFDWTPRTGYLPIVTAGQEPIFADDETAFAAIEKPNVDFHDVVYLPEKARSLVTARKQPGVRLVIKEFSSNHQTLEVDTPGAAMVCISQAYYHDWEASVDGVVTPLWRANYAFQAVEAPAGKHEIKLRYRDRAYWIGTLLAAMAGLAGLVIWFACPKKPVK